MTKHLIRTLSHSFKEKGFNSTETIERPFVRRTLTISSRRLLTKSEMPKITSGFYAVRVGYKPGVYQSWEECEKQVKKYIGARYKKFATLQEAENFVKEGNDKRENSKREIPTSLCNLSNKHSIPSSSVHSSTSDVNNGELLRVWTDGSSHNNGRSGARAGVGVYWSKNNPCNVSERLPGSKQTNIRAEIMAVIRALETCPDNSVPLEIRTDSLYTIDAFNYWIPRWEKDNKWKTTKNKNVENKELFQRLMKLVRAHNAEVIFEYVPGHVGVKENEEADKLANLGAMMDAIDDPYDYGEDDISQNHKIPLINENYQILINNEYNKNLDYFLTEDDLFSAEEKLEIENEMGMKFV